MYAGFETEGSTFLDEKEYSIKENPTEGKSGVYGGESHENIYSGIHDSGASRKYLKRQLQMRKEFDDGQQVR